MRDEFGTRFIVNPSDDGPLLTAHLGAASAELAAKIAPAVASLDELEACLAALEHKLHAEADRPYADEALEGLGYVFGQLAAATADLGRRRDELADWLARCRRPALHLKFRRPAWCGSSPTLDPAEFERRVSATT